MEADDTARPSTDRQIATLQGKVERLERAFASQLERVGELTDVVHRLLNRADEIGRIQDRLDRLMDDRDSGEEWKR